VATLEGIYGRDVNGTYYINANLDAPDARFTGADQRPRWTSRDTSRVNNNIDNAIVLKNQNVGRSWNVAGSLEKAFRGGLFAKAAYSYGEARNTIDPGSIADGSWINNEHAGDPNNPGLGYSANSPGHRAFVTLAYKGRFLPIGETGISLFAESRTIGNASYTFSGDLNGDGGPGNDLIYIARDRSEMNFEPYTIGRGASARTFTAAEQADAWEAYIQQDDYLRKNRGRYAERGAVFLPRVLRTDVSITQDISRALFGRRNAVQLRLDILNAGNLLARDWGVAQRLVTDQPLVAAGADANGAARYRLVNFSGQLLQPRSYQRTAGLGDVYQFQIGARYTFGN